jgi:prepilin peptidase CpaA
LLFVEYLIIWLFIGLLGWGAYSDLRSYVIPNRVCLAIVGLYPAYVLASPPPVDWVGALAVSGIIFGIGFVMFTMRLMGGGDIKLLTATALWAGPQNIFLFLVVTGLAGGLLSLAAIIKLRMSLPRQSTRSGFGVWLGPALKANVAYGIGVAAGGMFVALRLMAG